ncbi:hypothetical protein C8J56DRAFT_203132 [Mycena floridula]|nr:hypothetical protein C8J56DRAFT_203132 [Mycena floridula]
MLFRSSPLADGLYVLDAIIGGTTTPLTRLATSNTFQIFQPNTIEDTSSHKSVSRTAIIAGSVCGSLVFLLLLIGGLVLVVRRNRSRQNQSQFHSDNMVVSQELEDAKRLPIEPFNLQVPLSVASSSTEKSRSSTIVQAKESQIQTKDIQVQERQLQPTERQVQIRNELSERVAQLEQAMQLQATTSAAENARLRAEVQWLRDHQESDWALGLTDEFPPSYLDIPHPSLNRS